MSAGAEPKRGARGPGGNRRSDRTTPKVNRAQMRAMEVRAAETVRTTVREPEITEEVVAVPSPGGRRVSALSRRRPVAKPIVLTKEEEYRYIRADLRRLALTAGGLFVLMIVLLFILG